MGRTLREGGVHQQAARTRKRGEHALVFVDRRVQVTLRDELLDDAPDLIHVDVRSDSPRDLANVDSLAGGGVSEAANVLHDLALHGVRELAVGGIVGVGAVGICRRGIGVVAALLLLLLLVMSRSDGSSSSGLRRR